MSYLKYTEVKNEKNCSQIVQSGFQRETPQGMYVLKGVNSYPKCTVLSLVDRLCDRLEHTLYIQILFHLMFQDPDLLFLFCEFQRMKFALVLHSRRQLREAFMYRQTRFGITFDRPGYGDLHASTGWCHHLILLGPMLTRHYDSIRLPAADSKD
jgi:hypothetical protein